MIISIYSAVLLSLMFLMNLVSFSILICSVRNYLKNRFNKELQEQIDKINYDINVYTEALSVEQSSDKVKEYTDKLLDLKKKLSDLESKKK